jgi:hypothetical protein
MDRLINFRIFSHRSPINKKISFKYFSALSYIRLKIFRPKAEKTRNVVFGIFRAARKIRNEIKMTNIFSKIYKTTSKFLFFFICSYKFLRLDKIRKFPPSERTPDQGRIIFVVSSHRESKHTKHSQ